jgi:hypothetical protein
VKFGETCSNAWFRSPGGKSHSFTDTSGALSIKSVTCAISLRNSVESHEFKSCSQNAKGNGYIDGDKSGTIIQQVLKQLVLISSIFAPLIYWTLSNEVGITQYKDTSR